MCMYVWLVCIQLFVDNYVRVCAFIHVCMCVHVCVCTSLVCVLCNQLHLMALHTHSTHNTSCHEQTQRLEPIFTYGNKINFTVYVHVYIPVFLYNTTVSLNTVHTYQEVASLNTVHTYQEVASLNTVHTYQQVASLNTVHTYQEVATLNTVHTYQEAVRQATNIGGRMSGNEASQSLTV